MTTPSSADASAGDPQLQTEAHGEIVPIDLIDDSPYQIRLRLDHDRIAALAASIEDLSLATRVLLRRKPDGRFELICGANRVAAYRLLKRTTIRAEVRRLSDCEAACLASADNLQRSDLSDYEVSRAVELLLSLGFASTESDVARIIGRSRSYVTKVKAFSDLSPEAISIVCEKPRLFGANLVADVKAGHFNQSHPDLVAEACLLLKKTPT